jgi:hypothetical protein
LNRLGDVIRRAQFQTGDFVSDFAEGREEYHSDIRRIGIRLDSAANLEAVDIRHHDIQKNEIGFDALCNIESRLAARRRENAMPIAIEDANEDLKIYRSVIDNENGLQAWAIVVEALPFRIA